MSTLVSDSLKIEGVANSTIARDVRAGLTRRGQKELHAEYFYDDLGSALFEAITLLPEYGLTRADARLLSLHSSEIAERVGGAVVVAELGSGTGQKTRHVLQALRKGQRDLRYLPIDVSALALERCVRDLESFARVEPVQASYLPGLERVTADRQTDDRLLVLFLGSTIGNFGPEDALGFVRAVRETLRPGDAVLLGADLVKPVEQLLVAYDDPTGVTAAFNLNILARLNRELRANFDLRQFSHEARYDQQWQRVEMHLRSQRDQTVEIPGAGCTVQFTAGETIWTESSHKYELPQLESMARQGCFRVEAQWVDCEWPFAESLWMAV